MYARWRIDNGQPVNKVVLLGPTFVSYRENEFAVGNPTTYDGWKIYMDYLIQNGVDVMVVSDGPGSRQAKDFEPSRAGNNNGSYEYIEPFWGDPHYSSSRRATNNNEKIKQLIYAWLYSD